MRKLYIFLVTILILSSCMSMKKDRDTYILENIDIEQTLQIAEYELEQNETGSSLTLWAIRDQNFTKENAVEVERLYFKYILKMPGSFDTWHFTWAISNIYRQGNAEVQSVLQEAYDDASELASTISKTSDTLSNSEELYRGDVHFLGRGFAKSHLVVPGNNKYLQSAEEFFENQE